MSPNTSLDKLKPGDTGIIRSIHCDNTNGTDLMEMGLINGTEVRLVKFAPLGDPLEIQVRGYHLSIRRSEAKEIAVEKK
jgi:Fe2+ transport system protein FeoA